MIICLKCGLEFDIVIMNNEEQEVYILKYCPICGKDNLDTEDTLDNLILGVN